MDTQGTNLALYVLPEACVTWVMSHLNTWPDKVVGPPGAALGGLMGKINESFATGKVLCWTGCGV